MKIKLGLLYTMLLVVLALGGYAVFQCIPEEQAEEIEPYEYEEIIPFINVPAVESSAADDETPAAVQYDFDGLISQNGDFIGWLSIPDTNISLPVVLGGDNQYYLKHSFSKSYSIYGCPFLDTRTPLDGDNLVIHGHNMGYNREEMFSSLVYYQEEEYAKQHSVITFATPGKEGEAYDYSLFAVLNVDVNDESCNYIGSTFETPEDRTEFLSWMQEKSLYPTSEIPEGQILVLSTCNRVYGADNRLLIVAINNSAPIK